MRITIYTVGGNPDPEVIAWLEAHNINYDIIDLTQYEKEG